ISAANMATSALSGREESSVTCGFKGFVRSKGKTVNKNSLYSRTHRPRSNRLKRYGICNKVSYKGRRTIGNEIGERNESKGKD
ncbi:UNVERIFIED_CONTAM: hypothetical protein Sindi_0066700, partial [Sesamum indicum]